MSLTIHFDGLCEPKNPGGVATYGFVVRKGAKLVHEECGLAAEPWSAGATNNVAEYTGVLKGLEWALAEGHEKETLNVVGDSELVIKQLKGEYKVKSPLLAPIFKRVRDLSFKFSKLSFKWVPRAENAEADALTNRAYAEFIGSSRKEKRSADESIRLTRGFALEMDVAAAPTAVWKLLSKGHGIEGKIAERVENRFLSLKRDDGSRIALVLTPLADGTRMRCEASGLVDVDPELEKNCQLALLALQSKLSDTARQNL